MDFLTFLSIVIPAILQSWPLVALFVFVCYKFSIDKLVGRIASVTWDKFSVVFGKDPPQLSPLVQYINITPDCGAIGFMGASPQVSCRVGATLAS